MVKKGPKYLIDPEVIRSWPVGHSRRFSTIEAANSFRQMIYRAGRRTRRIRIFDQKTGQDKFIVEVWDRENNTTTAK
jgi:hypothetical protein